MHNPQPLKYAEFCEGCPLMQLPSFLEIQPYIKGANCLTVYLIRLSSEVMQQMDKEALWLMVKSLTDTTCTKCGKGCTVAPGLFEMEPGIKEAGITVIIEDDATSALRYN